MTSPLLQLGDPTDDEELFDKVVDEFGAAECLSKLEDVSIALSNLSIGEVEDSVSVLAVKGNQSLDFSEPSKNDAYIGKAQSDDWSEGASGRAKGASVKEVQWSDFSANSQQFGQNIESDLFLGSGSDRLVTSQAFSEPDLNLTANTDGYVSSSVGSFGQCSSDLSEIQKWEKLYPGWKYDTVTGQWYQLDDYDSTANTQSDLNIASENIHGYREAKVQSAFEGSVADNHRQVSHSILETISEESSSLNNWNHVSQGSIIYPNNMVFDPQYPEWYYDTITQTWYTLESYIHAFRDVPSATQDQQTNNVNAFIGSNIDRGSVSYGTYAQTGLITMQDQSSQNSQGSAYSHVLGDQRKWNEQSSQEDSWNASGSGYGLQSTWQQINNKNNWKVSSNESDQHNMWQPELLIKNGDVANNQQTWSYYDSLKYTGSQPDKQLDFNKLEPLFKHNYGKGAMTVPQGYATENTYPFTQLNTEQKPPTHFYNSNHARSTAGRPSHALVTFGFGGTVLVMKDASFSSSSIVSGIQGTIGGVVLIHSLMDLTGDFDYVQTLCQQSFPGPLVGGNAASKDVNKWMDDRITSSESSSMDFQNGYPLRLLLSLLKVLCQHYGKLRSPYGIEPSIEGNDSPESAVSKLFASAKRKDAPVGGFGSSMHWMKNLPSEGNITTTANEVQNLLLSGRKKEALQRAQEGQFWGLALVLAAQFGEQFYAETVKKMALQQFMCGSPLRTLCLLIAGQPADVFSEDNFSGLPGSANGYYQSSQVLTNTMLDVWQENLAIITSNRTKNDELVIIHLGDCLWKERGEVTAAHTCYLVAEANFEQYSDSARLCLIGVDHMKNPRTYACPDAIQRTEIYEYSKVIGNPQFVLLPFQPYKLVYAYMLAELGKMSDSLRYCQATMKMLKNSGRSPQLDLLRTLFSSLEERLRTYQQGGYGTNLAPTKLVGKLFNSIDRSIHRMIGSPPFPPILQNSGGGRDNNSLLQKVSNSQSTMAITSLMPPSSSVEVEAVGEWTVDNSRKVMQNRSISEPDFGRNVKQVSSKNGGSISDRRSRFGRFGSQLLQKTVGWVSWSRHDRQAKLGESNKFYYDEKLKRWVEEGAELPIAEASLPPPPTASSFQNSTSDYGVNNAMNSNELYIVAQPGTKLDASSEQGFGFPPMPPSQNQFSAQNRVGVRSRYVDTFNKGGGSFTSSFQSPSAPFAKPLAGPSFFVPSAPPNYNNQTNEATVDDELLTSTVHEPPLTTSTSMQRFSSMDNIASSRTSPSDNDSLSRARAASWSGAFADISNTKEAIGSHIRSGSGMDNLHEVEL